MARATPYSLSNTLMICPVVRMKMDRGFRVNSLILSSMLGCRTKSFLSLLSGRFPLHKNFAIHVVPSIGSTAVGIASHCISLVDLNPIRPSLYLSPLMNTL
uniref:Uncharacterized protein n=1 Tax=Cacopsylla melanoneura TaxID=428564 RepID=A0A8D8VYI3_9HEMI